MAKRYTDTNKWDDPWYFDLPINFKLAWDYITAKCDAVGVWKPSKKHLEFNIGMPVDMVDFLNFCGPERISLINNGSWWIKKFCDFQYGELKEDSKSPTTQSYIKMLKKHNLWEGYIKGIYRVCNTPKEKDIDKEEEKEDNKKESDFSDSPPVVNVPRESKTINKLEVFEMIFTDELYIEGLASVHRNKDIKRAFEECYIHHSNAPNPPIELGEWKQKLNTWLINTKNGINKKADAINSRREAFAKRHSTDVGG